MNPLSACELKVSQAFESIEDEIPSEYLCPISQDIMHDPVIAADGITYEREEIEAWLSTSDLSPCNGDALQNKELIPNVNLRTLIQDYQRSQREHEEKKSEEDSAALNPGIPSDNALMVYLAQCLNVNEQAVRSDIVVEQALVEQAGIKRTQAGARFRRDPNNLHTVFWLRLNEKEYLQCLQYYQARFPKLIQGNERLDKIWVKITMETRLLYHHLAPTLTTPIPSHQALMMQFARCIEVKNYSEVSSGIAVEQALVKKAGIEHMQTGAQFRREKDSPHTTFLLYLTEKEHMTFLSYYQTHFPKLVTANQRLDDQRVKVTVDTGVLYYQVAPILNEQQAVNNKHHLAKK